MSVAEIGGNMPELTFLIYSEDRELIRTACHLNINEIRTKLNRHHKIIFAENEE